VSNKEYNIITLSLGIMYSVSDLQGAVEKNVF